jgi:NADPH:quinone reductase-like Zn-dependent oxidoreductase
VDSVLSRIKGVKPRIVVECRLEATASRTISGLEISGEVVALGSETSRFAVGYKVIALIPGGGYADYAVADERTTLHLPEGLDMVEAAALPETFMTVWANLFQRGGFKRGETVVIALINSLILF